MEGQGVTNYAVSRPVYGYTAETTEFDDALIQHGIVTHEQALVAKGATVEQAQGLVAMQAAAAKNKNQMPQQHNDQNPTKDDDDDDDDDSFVDDDDDVDFIAEYRQKRIRELQKQAALRNRFGRVYPIARPDWQKEVNDVKDFWVVVCLTSHDMERTGMVEAAIAQLATIHQNVKFVSIPYLSAIDNWPHEQLPTLFCYRDEIMQHSLISIPVETHAPQLETLLRNKGVLNKEQEAED